MAETNQTLLDGIAKAKKIMADALLTANIEAVAKFVFDAVNKAKYHNLTGNTITSISVGVYKGGKLYGIADAVDVANLAEPTFHKISDRDIWYHFKDYDNGEDVNINGHNAGFMNTDEDYGYNTSYKFLSTHKPTTPNGITVCTGTEYSTFLESVRGLNVLTDTFQSASSLYLSCFKPIQ